MMILILLLIPFVAGLLVLPFNKAAVARGIALVSTLASFALTLLLAFSDNTYVYSVDWIYFLGTHFSLGYDGLSLLMLVLTALLFPFIILAGSNQRQQKPALYALLLFSQSALTGVFLAQDAFLFYVFWELALIPIFFILLLWGGENRRKTTLKFFIYTLFGSLFLLYGIIYLYQLTPGTHSTEFPVFGQLLIPEYTQRWLFWILFIAFAIKMPLFPFHTWQPQTYTMAPVQGLMVLAGIMTKMGIYGAVRFIFPIVPLGAAYWQSTIIILALAGMVYASVIAFRQDNLKTLLAYSSMAHISLMVAAMFAINYYAWQGMYFQVIAHGITIVILFYLAHTIEWRSGALQLSQMGGFKLQAPRMATALLLAVLASIALPLTAGFVGEFLMITGLFQQSVWYAVIGALTMIFSAVYMLYAYQRVMLGDTNAFGRKLYDLQTADYVFLVPLIALLIMLGVFPQPIFNLVETTLQHLAAPFQTMLSSII